MKKKCQNEIGGNRTYNVRDGAYCRCRSCYHTIDATATFDNMMLQVFLFYTLHCIWILTCRAIRLWVTWIWKLTY